MKNNIGTWIELSRRAFESNIKQIKNIVGDSVNISVVVKSNGYGHGLISVAQLCQQSSSVDWLCTVFLSEALAIRDSGVTKPILVLSYIDQDPVLAIEQNIDLIVQDMETALFIHEQAQKIKKAASIHIKVDTGLSRLGFAADIAFQTVKAIMELPYLKVRGISTHFADTSNPASSFTVHQSDQFKKLLDRLVLEGIDISFRHAANSAATINHADNRYNFVRIGAAAYGLLPSTAQLQQTPIATWKATIAFIKTVRAGSFVGYDCTYQATQETKIAILPIGYYNGYSRRLSNAGIVLVYDRSSKSYRHVPVIGRVAMNHTIINISGINDVEVADQVILMGPYDKVRPYDLAQYAQSHNPREITTTIHELIKRVVVLENGDNASKNAVELLSNDPFLLIDKVAV